VRILILSKDGDGLGIAYKLTLEGHHVDMWIEKPQYKHDLKGIINRVTEWRPLVPKADLILCDMVGFSQHEALFQKYAKPYLCCNPVADVMELDRLKGLDTFKRLGIEQPKYWHYKNIKECEADLDHLWEKEDQGTGFVIKPFGNLDCGKTYLIPNKELFKWALATYPKDTQLIVQVLIPEESSVEVSTEGWFNGREFIQPFNHTFEEKRLMVGNVGKMTGCMGNLVITVPKPNRLVRETVLKMEPVLKKAGYRGPLDINCIVTKEQVFGLEMTCRCGYDAVEALMQGLREPMANLLFETAVGTKKSMDISTDYLLCVRVTRDPYPAVAPAELKKEDQDFNMPIMGLTAKDMDHVFLCDVFLDDAGVIRYGAADGVLLKATSFGKTIEQARERAYRVVHNVQGIDIGYRTDIGVRAEKQLSKLREWGWI
jgi:phosphoribosylamine---glycine ligase